MPPPPTLLPDNEADAEQVMAASKAARAKAILEELASRRIEGLKLYEPLPVQAAFHASRAPEVLARGSNRSGKTLVAAVEVARAVTGQDPNGKYPLTNGRWFLVGKDGRHLGDVMFRKLFRAGAFRIIRDQQTRTWRAFRPWVPEDAARKKESKPAPPLIPERFIASIAWENKKLNVPSMVTLRNGWELSFFSSLGKPPKGSDIDGAWFDEEVVDKDWYPEIAARLLDRSGRFIWGATPEVGTDQLFELHERCEKERLQKEPQAEEFFLLLADNPHVSEDQKQAFAEKLGDSDIAAVKVHGHFAISSTKVYPEFVRRIHEVPYFEIPADWTRYAVVDPGHQVCAVLFAAVPPPPERETYFYDELYIKHCDAATFGEKMRHKTAGQIFHAFLMDSHGGNITQVGSGRTVEEQYSEALKKNNVRSTKTGFGFIWGSDDVEGGIEAFRSWLRIGETGKPRLRVLATRLENFIYEISRYHYKRDPDGTLTDKPNQKRANHLMDAARYLASYDPHYYRPPKVERMSAVALWVKADKEKEKNKAGGEFVHFGPRRQKA